ncbi:hypothetical protein CEXT_192131 [Caerostris extrusa]|uniref:Uncharacterized protein n=1 Tax=Caerostris extrusa TaxID=172846 RepID=A0AAV4NZL2_CAEEX|nr:hypothetical protein CEXT_192131 [Caerostris extrusa]
MMAHVKYQTTFFKFVQLWNNLPQGSVKSFTMFNVMVNDLICNPTTISRIICLAFSYNMVIYTTGADISVSNNRVNESMKAWKIGIVKMLSVGIVKCDLSLLSNLSSNGKNRLGRCQEKTPIK